MTEIERPEASAEDVLRRILRQQGLEHPTSAALGTFEKMREAYHDSVDLAKVFDKEGVDQNLALMNGIREIKAVIKADLTVKRESPLNQLMFNCGQAYIAILSREDTDMLWAFLKNNHGFREDIGGYPEWLSWRGD